MTESPLQQRNTTFTSSKIPNLKTFIQDEQNLLRDAACNDQAKIVCTCNFSYNKSF